MSWVCCSALMEYIKKMSDDEWIVFVCPECGWQSKFKNTAENRKWIASESEEKE